MKRTLLLVYPKTPPPCYLDISAVQPLVNKRSLLLHAGLATIAGLTPPGFDIRIVDESVEALDFSKSYDIVGISGHQFQTNRAREIAETFRAKGSLVVCGGPCVSVTPEKYRDFSDVLVVGEAERQWPRFIEDYLAGCHKPEYLETERVDLSLSPVPDYSGFAPKSVRQYMSGIVQTSRGCPYDCEYCAAIVYLGRKIRRKPVDTVIREVEQLQRHGIRFIWLADDNFSAGRKEAKHLLRALRAWNQRQKYPTHFSAALTLETARDEEFLELAAEAGLTRVSIGIGSEDENSLREANKLQNVHRDIDRDVKAFHEHGILVSGGCMVGFDSDDIGVFERQRVFFTRLAVGEVRVYLVQALEGTRLKTRMEKEGRWNDWDRAEELGRQIAGDRFVPSLFNVPTMIPKQMTVAELRQGALWLLAQLNDFEAAGARLKHFFSNYERSPKRGKIVIPRGRHTVEDLGTAWRVIRYWRSEATSTEKRVLKELLSAGGRSGHPQRFSYVIGALLPKKNNEAMLRAHGVEGKDIKYPERESERASGRMP